MAVLVPPVAALGLPLVVGRDLHQLDGAVVADPGEQATQGLGHVAVAVGPTTDPARGS